MRISTFSFIKDLSGLNDLSIKGIASNALDLAESYTQIKNKLSLVDSASISAARGLESVFDISMRTAQSINATSSVYQRFAQNAETLKISQEQIANLTETVSKAVAISGASAASAEAALTQFGQALASGVFRGDEFNSVMEQTPALGKAIADGLGVSNAELRQMAKDGKLTMDVLIPALEKAKASVDADFAKRVLTIGDAFTNLQTAAVKGVGELDKSFRATQNIAKGIDLLAQNLDIAMQAALAFGVSLSIGKLSQYGAAAFNNAKASFMHSKALREEAVAIHQKIQAERQAAQAVMARLNAEYQLAQSEQTRMVLRERMKSQAQQIIALANQEAVAKRNLTAANALASRAMTGLKNVMNVLGGPMGVVSLAGFALYSFAQSATEARDRALDAELANQKLAQSYDQLSEAALSNAIRNQITELENYQKQIENIQAGIKTRLVESDFDGFTISGGINDEALDKLKDDIKQIEDNAKTAQSALEKMLLPLGSKMLSAGKNIDEVRDKFRLLGITGEQAENIIATLQSSIGNTKGTERATAATFDLKKAFESLEERSLKLSQKLEVAKLKQQGQAKSAYVLAGLYDLLGKEGAEYNEVLVGIATGTITAANAADKAVGLSLETLNKILEGKAVLDQMFTTENNVATIETNIKESHKKTGAKAGENARDSWLNFYDEIRKKSSSSLAEIDLEQARMFQRLEEHNKKGVVSYQEYETAKTAIAERFARQRLELAGKYAPEKLLKANLDDDLKNIQELYAKGQLNPAEMQKAAQQVQFNYAQQVSQSAVDPLAQIRGMYDPQQEMQNRLTQELAQLQAFNEQKLMSEEDYQKRRQEVINRYRNNQFQEDMNNYASGLNSLGGAFGNLASMVEQSAGKQSAAYKAMFAISKAFAIAEATVKLSQAIAQAMASPEALTPAQKFANMAAVASAGINLISQITSVGFAQGGVYRRWWKICTSRGCSQR